MAADRVRVRVRPTPVFFVIYRVVEYQKSR